jgi:hypothetical protein
MYKNMNDRHCRKNRALCVSTALIVTMMFAGFPRQAMANNYGESLGWQFQTSTDRANQAAVLDLILKQRGGYYATPVYTTNIARQYNCSIAATASGNSGTQTALANSPTVTGATSTATGNDNSTTMGGGHGTAGIDGTQANSGAVSSGITGATVTNVHGTAWQALNSSQSNSGSQTAQVQGSNACAFAALN